MRCNRSIVGVGLLCAVGSLALAGCNWVSRDESLDTAMSKDGTSSAEIYGYVPPDENRAVDLTPDEPTYQSAPRVIVLEDSRDDDAVGAPGGTAPVVVAPSDAQSASFRDFSFDVKHQLEAMERDLAELEARAEVKGGGAAEAAVEPAARDLRMYREQIESRLVELQSVEDLSIAARRQAEINELLYDARLSLRRAEAEVNRIPAVD
jgi:hypothetical protein